ncbi:MAG: hypothetical protein ACLUIQ_11245 [Dialister invisus]
MEIKIGTVGTAGRTVTEKDTALAVKAALCKSLPLLFYPPLWKRLPSPPLRPACRQNRLR